MRFMKILFYLPTPGGMTGAPRRMLNLAQGLRELGVEVIIASEADTAVYAAASHMGISTISMPLPKILSLRQRALFAGSVLFKTKVAFAILLQQWRFFLTALRTESDIIWIRGSKGIAFVGIGAYLSKKSIVWDVDHELPSSGVVRTLHRIGLFISKSVVLQHNAAKSIFGEKISRRYADKIRVITPGIQVNELLRKKENLLRSCSGKFRILQVGTLCDRKNQLFSIGVLSKVSRSLRDSLEFVLVGGVHDKLYQKQLLSAVERFDLQDCVRFVGWHDDTSLMMLQSDLLLMPSKDEGVPNTVQEAMTLGLPVMASDRGGIPEILMNEYTGWVIPLNQQMAWVSNIEKLVAEPNLLNYRSVRAQDFSRLNFSISIWSKKYLNILKKIV